MSGIFCDILKNCQFMFSFFEHNFVQISWCPCKENLAWTFACHLTQSHGAWRFLFLQFLSCTHFREFLIFRILVFTSLWVFALVAKLFVQSKRWKKQNPRVTKLKQTTSKEQKWMDKSQQYQNWPYNTRKVKGLMGHSNHCNSPFSASKMRSQGEPICRSMALRQRAI